MKTIKLYFYLFFVMDLMMQKVQSHSYHFDPLTDENVVIIYSVTICELKFKKKRLRIARGIPICAATLLFLSVMFAVFHNHSPLLTLSRNTTEKTLLNASKKINLPVRNLVCPATFSLKKCAITHPSKCTVKRRKTCFVTPVLQQIGL